MPTYEYRCPEGHEFEQFVQKISLAARELPCPTCGKVAERRISAGGGFVFKGSGFYITDYGKDGKKDLRANAAAASSAADKPAASAKSEGSSSGATDSKGQAAAPSGAGGTKSETSGKGESAKPSSKGDGPAAPKSGSSDK
jgi:putative FmdB family regulatory protein